MKRVVSPDSEQRRHSNSTADDRHAVKTPDFTDNRPDVLAQRQLIAGIAAAPKMTAQRKMIASIHTSPRMLAQRKLFNYASDAAAQLQRMPEEDLLQGRFDPAQRMQEEEPLQGKFDTVQRVEDEELLQRKFIAVQKMEEEEPLQGKSGSGAPVQREEAHAAPSPSNNTGLPDNLKSGIESLSGISMDNVRVHYNSGKPAQLNALAYAQGTDIHLAPGQEQHLPHEAWHVVQQAQGRVQPTMQLKEGVPVNDDQGLEREADVMGAAAVQKASESAESDILHDSDAKPQKISSLIDTLPGQRPSVQRKVGFEFEVGLPFGTPGEKVETMIDSYYKLVDPKLGPDVHIHDGAGFHVVEDHGGMKILDVESIVEYVIDAEEEYKDETTFLANVKNAKAHIDKFPAGTQTKFPSSDSEYLLGGGEMQGAGKRGVGQATFAVRMEGITSMFDNKIKDDFLGGEDNVLFSKRILELAKQVAAETIKLNGISTLGEVKKVEGYLALVAQYLAANSLSKIDAEILDKNRVPFLVRSQLSVIRNSTLNAASQAALTTHKDNIYNKMIAVSGAEPDKAIIPGKTDPKTKVWLEGAISGMDPAIAWGQSKTINPEEIGSSGANRESGGVVEQRHLKFGPINVSDWEASATKVYNEARKLNGID
ncbi:protein of unknown function [Nitrosomonas sp. Nm51]|uniref:eCIS core domain-containing protein n=1 Tax=Nitrosomonas sp. Nm51 TaxID=133720 RepID=UPI0008AF6CA1|nr:DUF4157 domain-containing protein [Nitrosomonas sp. Nm51]SEQ98816.1 protein of unknown function [Nitrosomonas sp. Nm51]